MNINNPNMMKPGTAPAPDWDTHYGSAFKWGYVPKGNQIRAKGQKHDPNQIGLIAPISPDFYKWKDASSDPRVQGMKENWSKTWSTIPRYKQNQITASVNEMKKRQPRK
jgi:hypothetical protein